MEMPASVFPRSYGNTPPQKFRKTNLSDSYVALKTCTSRKRVLPQLFRVLQNCFRVLPYHMISWKLGKKVFHFFYKIDTQTSSSKRLSTNPARTKYLVDFIKFDTTVKPPFRGTPRDQSKSPLNRGWVRGFLIINQQKN